MSKKLEDERMRMEMVWIEKLVPEDHLVRKLDRSSDKGRPSIEPAK
ncbi:hypothetical protein [Halalkalibacter hemicellulosilyticus]|nr:hypothetical protein [Halalkalibacter hemicellulosilyticus]